MRSDPRLPSTRGRTYAFEPLWNYVTKRWPDVITKREDLADWSPNGMPTMQAAMIMAVNATNLHRYRKHGIREVLADRICCVLGVHMQDIWPEYWELDDAYGDDAPPLRHKRPA